MTRTSEKAFDALSKMTPTELLDAAGGRMWARAYSSGASGSGWRVVDAVPTIRDMAVIVPTGDNTRDAARAVVMAGGQTAIKALLDIQGLNNADGSLDDVMGIADEAVRKILGTEGGAV